MFKRPNPWVASAGLILACVLTFAFKASAQLIRVDAGVSDLLPSAGGSINFQGTNYTGYLGAGDLAGAFGLGAYVRTTIDSHVVTLGDQPIAVDFPTDVFGTNHYFQTRGIGMIAQEGKANIFLFAGGTATATGMSFFQTARTDAPAGMLFTDLPLSSSLHFYSKTVISRQRTSIQALDWRPRKWLRTGFAGGVGSNKPYLATTADIERDWLSLKTAYIAASDRFRRVTAPSVFSTEVDGANMVAAIKPYSGILLTVGRQSFLQPQSAAANTAFLRANVSQAQSTFDVAQFRFGAGIFRSDTQNYTNVAEAFSASRKITNCIDVGANYFRTISGTGPHTSDLSTSIRETLSPRIGLLQVVNYSQGRTTLLYGGSYLSNRFTIGVDYQTLYLPFRANPFSQGISISLHVRLFGSMQTNLQTFRSADGRLRYTASGSTLMTNNFRPVRGDAERALKHLNYVIRGRVLDEKGQPVEGAAIRIGEELIFTNMAGEFFVRYKKAETLYLQVVFGEFLNAAAFRLISAPQMATASQDTAGPEILVVLARK